MYSLARVISFISNPIFVLLPVPYLLIFRFGFDRGLAFRWTLFSFFFLFLAGAFVWYEVKRKVFSDMDVSKREQRGYLFSMLGAITLFYFVSLFIFHAPPILFITVWGIMVGIVLVTLINTRVKASLHVGTITAVLITFIKLYDWSAWLLLVIPIVAWSRVKVKRHSELGVFVGGVFGISLTLLMYVLLKYIYGISV